MKYITYQKEKLFVLAGFILLSSIDETKTPIKSFFQHAGGI
jgi:hypothetical protein